VPAEVRWVGLADVDELLPGMYEPVHDYLAREIGCPMATRTRKRRNPGEGSVWPCRTKAGRVRYAIGYVVTAPDGTRRSITRRVGPNGEKWTTERDAKRAPPRGAHRRGQGRVDRPVQAAARRLPR
jgi:hypothetical protein